MGLVGRKGREDLVEGVDLAADAQAHRLDAADLVEVTFGRHRGFGLVSRGGHAGHVQAEFSDLDIHRGEHGDERAQVVVGHGRVTGELADDHLHGRLDALVLEALRDLLQVVGQAALDLDLLRSDQLAQGFDLVDGSRNGTLHLQQLHIGRLQLLPAVDFGLGRECAEQQCLGRGSQGGEVRDSECHRGEGTLQVGFHGFLLSG